LRASIGLFVATESYPGNLVTSQASFPEPLGVIIPKAWVASQGHTNHDPACQVDVSANPVVEACKMEKKSSSVIE